MIKYWFLISVVCLVYPACAERDMSVYAPSAILIDQKTGYVFYEKKPDQLYHPASITKILTAFIGIRDGNLSDSIKVSRGAAYSIERGSSSIALKPGEVVTLKDVLYGLMLRSANECGNIVAEYIKEGNDSFAKYMNEVAKSLGAKHSNFVNPHGLHHKDHLVTARDMAVITRHALNLPFFRELIKTKYYPFPDTNKHKHSERGNLKNKNKLLHKNKSEYFEFATGVKAGFTRKSLHTFVGSAKKGQNEVIAVVLREKNKKNMYNDIKGLLTWGLEQYSEKVLIEEKFLIQEQFLEKGNDILKIETETGLKRIVPTPLDLKLLKQDITINLPLPLPIRKGDVVGHMNLSYETTPLGKVTLVAKNTVLNKYSWENLKKYVIRFPVLLGIATLACVGILFIPIQKK